MKPIKAQESTRRDYHRDAFRNTVHRSSLLAPRIPGSRVEISFVNHFLMKRGYTDVACRITAIDERGAAVDSRTHPVSEPRVHVFELSEIADENVANYLIEFFSASNLFIPFPAAMVNHRNDRFFNMVHSYNRVLNDVFEDDEINSTRVREASIDVHVDGETDTFALFTSGPAGIRDDLGVRVADASGVRDRRVPLDLPRLTNEMISLRELYGDTAVPDDSVLTIQQPPQPMFYGRMLVGMRCPDDGAFAANHSFYDCSEIAEYWDDDRPSYRVYPLFDGLRARVRLYPIYSPVRLHAAIDVFDADGRQLRTVSCEPLDSPGGRRLDVDVTGAVPAEEQARARSFRFRVWPEEGGTPRRINHQIVYEDAAGRSPLAASVAISLINPNAFRAATARGNSWGQCAVSADLDTHVGIVLDEADGETAPVELRFVGEQGEVSSRKLDLVAGSAFVARPAELFPELVPPSGERPHHLWYWATSERADLSAYSVVRHRASGHCSGEHSF